MPPARLFWLLAAVLVTGCGRAPGTQSRVPVLVITSATAASTKAPVGFGHVEGQVHDAAGEAAEGAVVNLDPPVTASAHVDARGGFSLAGVPPGRYTVIVSLPGHCPVERTLEVTAQARPLDIRLGAAEADCATND